tara:strand:+ start:37581 stop:40283 length:2703 start_codon:yes stop_codon:yes gene_type:complete
MKKIVTVTLCLFSLAFGQNQFWKPVDESHLIGDAQISTNHASYFELELSNLKNFLRTAPLKNNNQDLSTVQIQLPLPDGGTDNFMVFEAPIMEEGLANKFPNIKTFIFQSTSNQLRYGRADITLKGFHLMLFDEESTIFIDPFSKNNTDIYQVYFKKDCINNKPMPDCLSQEEASTEKLDDSMLKNNQTLNQLKSVKDSNGQTLRTYRIAVSATAEFTQFHGGTVAEGLSAVVTSINRVNGVYEREFTIRLVLVADNDQIIYTDENTDPFTNPNNAGALLGQNQNSVDNIIGSNNYDIGHVVGRSGSGLASYAVVCRNSKASATTGINNPTGDPFDIDYLAHEIGHQFAGSHTFNSNSGSCSGGNLSSNSAYEPGSATTIMGYAGICAPQNIQNNSDDYFHTRSFDQVLAYTTQFQGDNCPVKTNTGNNIPTIQILSPINKTIPKSTPFELQALANDIDGNAITYCWEQFDLGPTGDPNNPSGNAPLFRSFQPTPNPIRTFPQISDILDNDQTLGEILPDYGRDMSFRVTVRDNVPGGGAVNYDDYEVSVSNTAGPFVVNNPNTNITWTAGTNYDVEWNVANTNQNPVSCNTVNILLSTDGGYTFPITLLSNVPNNGLASVNAPFAFSNQARVRVEAADNIFFDISDENFEIESNCSLIDDPSINIDGPLNGATWCINTSGELYFSVSSPDLIITSYQWFFNGIAIPGATDSILAINNVQTSDGGNYDCTVSNGCSTVFSNTATVFVTSTLILPVITQVANQLQSSIATNIQWYLNGILLPGETNQYIDINASGSYSVSSVSGPCSANSMPYQITGFKDFNKVASISILPNPSQGNFRIQTTGWNKSIELEVLNLLGQTILGNMDFEKAFNLDLSELSDGVYIVSLRSDAYQSSHKLIKK